MNGRNWSANFFIPTSVAQSAEQGHIVRSKKITRQRVLDWARLVPLPRSQAAWKLALHCSVAEQVNRAIVVDMPRRADERQLHLSRDRKLL